MSFPGPDRQWSLLLRKKVRNQWEIVALTCENMRGRFPNKLLWLQSNVNCIYEGVTIAIWRWIYFSWYWYLLKGISNHIISWGYFHHFLCVLSLSRQNILSLPSFIIGFDLFVLFNCFRKRSNLIKAIQCQYLNL